MSNNLSGNADPFEVITSPYFNWLQNEVFPVLVGVTLILVFLVGLILNSIILHAIRIKRLQITSGKVFLINLIILDIVAYFFIVLPSLIAAFANRWILSDFVCIVSGAFVTACLLVTFYLHTLIFFERWMKITNLELHKQSFGRKKICVIIIIVMWVIFLIAGLLPKAGWTSLEYISHQHLCNINHKNNKIGMNLLFTFGIYIPAIVSFIFLVLVHAKKNEILENLSILQLQVNEANTKIDKIGGSKITSISSNMNNTRKTEITDTLSVSHIDSVTSEMQLPEPEIEVLSSGIIQDDATCISGSMTSRSETNIRNVLFPVISTATENHANRQAVTDLIYNTSQEHMDIHLTITYALMWGLTLLLWAPYVILCYLDVYNAVSIWGGWYSAVVPITHIVYCIKPIIYLSHNKVFRDAAYQTIPESVRTQTKKAQKVLKRTMNKVDDFIFFQGSDSSNLVETETKRTNTIEMATFSGLRKSRSKRDVEA